MFSVAKTERGEGKKKQQKNKKIPPLNFQSLSDLSPFKTD